MCKDTGAGAWRSGWVMTGRRAGEELGIGRKGLRERVGESCNPSALEQPAHQNKAFRFFFFL